MLQYLIKLSISLAVLYIFYRAVLRPLTFYQWNRFYLLCYSLLSFVIPFIDITSWMHSDENKELVNIIPAITSYNYTNPRPATTEVKLSLLQRLTVTDWLLIIFSLGVLVMIIKLIVQYLSLRSIRRRAVLLDNTNNVQLYETTTAVSPFSFGNAIYFNRQLHTDGELQRIIQHEFVHVKQKHTIDLLLGELLCVFNWFNPFAWLIRYSVRQNLEFIADNNVVSNGFDKKEYQYLLLKVVGIPQYSIANNFNFSNLKKRIAMMNKMKSTKLHLTKFLFVLPLLVVLLLAFRHKVNKPNELVFTGIIYNNEEPLLVMPGITVNEKYSGLSAVTDANGYFKLKIPFNNDSTLKIKYDFVLNNMEKTGETSKSVDLSGAQNFSNLIFVGINKSAKDAHKNILIPGLHELWSVSSCYHFQRDPDYTFVQDKFNEYRQQLQTANSIASKNSDSKKPFWFVNGIPYLLFADGIEGNSAFFDKYETRASSEYAVWLDGQLISIDEANEKVNRFELTAIGTCRAEFALKEYGVNKNVFILYWKTKFNPLKAGSDTIPPPPPPIPAVPATAKIALDFAPQTVNQQGYIISIADNHGECIVLVKDKSQKIIKALALTDWNKNKKENERKYGEIPPTPPPARTVSVDLGTGSPMSAENIQLRGPSKLLTGAGKGIPPDVLIIIDGVEATAGYNLNNLKGEDIKEMNIRKDKDATNLYGDKGKNGVIEITTKKNALEMKDNSGYRADSSVRMHFDQFIINGSITSVGNESIIDGAFSFENKTERPFVVFDGHEFLQLITCSPPKARYRMVILNPKEAIAKYGDKAKYGAVEITTIKSAQLQKKANEIAILTADTITWDKAHLVITGGSIIADGQSSVVSGDISFGNGFADLPLVVYNGKQVADFNSFRLTKVKVNILSLNAKESIAKYGPVAKNGALEINQL